ncbi:hypothetical protein K9L67_03000 [Candidatus Woesearchaeota archaeon]|nr:hypothetical protein [Candidatus Woesearchaeota archaeon]MCF7901169.1 hypothetical protein [Candidatus Woesearchaeota archaeon]MCF8013817.1 hypothetical protein [Candidatus Woesearchaeota archaeon]
MKQILSIGSSKLYKEASIYLKLYNFKEYVVKYTSNDFSQKNMDLILDELKHQNYGAVVVNDALNKHPNLLHKIAETLLISNKNNTALVYISDQNFDDIFFSTSI